MLDLLLSLEWAAFGSCPKCWQVHTHAPDCRLDRAIRGLAPEPTVDEMAREMRLEFEGGGYNAAVDGRAVEIYFATEKSPLGPPVWLTWGDRRSRHADVGEAIRTLYREHKANVKWTDAMLSDIGRKLNATNGTVHPALYSCGRPDCHVETSHEHRTVGAPEKPPTDPSALAAWLYARAVPGRTLIEFGGEFKLGIESVSRASACILVVPTGRELIRIPDTERVGTRLLNPDGSVLWEAK